MTKKIFLSCQNGKKGVFVEKLILVREKFFRPPNSAPGFRH